MVSNVPLRKKKKNDNYLYWLCTIFRSVIDNPFTTTGVGWLIHLMIVYNDKYVIFIDYNNV